MSFTRFRKHPATTSSSTAKPLQERQGNVPTLSPTNTRAYKSSRSHVIDDETISLTGSNPTRQNSFTMKTLNPRRLSLRLKSRPQGQSQPHSQSAPTSSSSSPSYSTTEHKQRHMETPSAGSSSGSVAGGRSEFVYKPVHRPAYPTVVAETKAQISSQRPVSRYQYNYIPTGRSRYPSLEETLPRSRSTLAYEEDQTELYRRDSNPYDDLDGQSAYSSLDAERARALASLQARPQRGEYAGETYTSAAEKRRSRAAKRLTTIMVPDADEIYDW
ncbi:hypothetical protein BJX64DRAFT_284971 [Aspergillus heterothallicus]